MSKAMPITPPPTGTIDLWSIRLTDLSRDLLTDNKRLSPAEKERAARFAFQRDRELFLGAHTVLRTILGRYTAIIPEALLIAVTKQNKPFLPDHPLQFNLSHSGTHILIGICHDADIGVDTEVIRPDIDLAIAKRFFSAEENDRLQALPASEQINMFFRLWAGKEAVIKMRGSGLAESLRAFSIDPCRDRQSVTAKAGWRSDLVYCALLPDYASAVACSAPIAQIRHGGWTEQGPVLSP